MDTSFFEHEEEMYKNAKKAEQAFVKFMLLSGCEDMSKPITSAIDQGGVLIFNQKEQGAT